MKKKKSAPKARKARSVKKARVYDNSARSQKSNLNRRKIIELYVNLLVDGGGQDVPLQVLAKKSKTSMRTLFRFFGDKNSLNQEIGDYLGHYLPSVHENLAKMSFEEYAGYSYRVFDEYEKLFKAYLYTGFGQKSRAVFRETFIDLLIKKVREELGTDPRPEHMLRIYFMVNLINAHIWNDLKEGFGVSGEQIADTVRWAMHTLMREIRR